MMKYLKEFRKGNVESEIVAMLIGVIIAITLLLWFFSACYNWMVMAFPTFEVFPRWAFILLMFFFTSGGSNSVNRK
jgi:UDP-N-acetylmuramyl pentapeptide phosphotransferase/UDP-N-acetylglucosamine-1-phosphate transferase